MMDEPRATIVVLTHNRRVQLLATLQSLADLPGRWPIIVVDNGSSDGTAEVVRRRFPSVFLIKARGNLGAAGRNLGVAFARTPYVAFSDDDTQWEPGALDIAVRILDSAPTVAVLNACVHVGANRRPDPACQRMVHSPLGQNDLPGPQLLGFMAGACVMRARAFIDVGGYWPPFFIGGEEALMALDLAERGWRMIYAEKVVTRHFPSSLRDAGKRTELLIRNAIWTAWMRRPWAIVWRETILQLRAAHSQGLFLRTLASLTAGLPRVLSRRHVVSPAVEAMQLHLDRMSRF